MSAGLYQVKEGRALLGHGWSPSFAVNQRAQSGLALIHILAALGYDWGLQLLIPLGAQLDLQVCTFSLLGIVEEHKWVLAGSTCPQVLQGCVFPCIFKSVGATYDSFDVGIWLFPSQPFTVCL